jgi:hypothetical protein
MRRHLAFLLITLLFGGCTVQRGGRGFLISPRRGAPASAQGAGQVQGSAPPGGVSDQPIEALNQVAAYLQQYGYQPAGPAVHNGGIQQGGLVAYAIEAQTGQCYVSVAVSAPGSNLDMVVLDPQGRPVSHDVGTDAHPHVAFCPYQSGRHIARLQMSTGGGDFYYILFAGSGSVEGPLATFFGATPEGGAGQPAAAQLDTTTQARIAAFDQRLAQQGYQRAGEPQGVVMEPRSDRSYPLNLQQGYCYSFATFGGPGTTDTDVFVVDATGTELQRDTSTDVDAHVEFCPPANGAYNLRSRLYAGSGPVFVSGWVRARDGQTGTPVSTGATQDVIAGQSSSGVGLEENYRLLQADMQARGYEGYGEPSRGALEEDASQTFQISLEGDKCYAILAVGDNGVRDLDLIVRDADGGIIDRDIEADARPVVRVCPEHDVEQGIEVRMASGSGRFVYAAYRWPRGTHGPFGISGLMYVRLAEVTSLLNVEGYQPSVDFSPERGRLRREGQEAHHRLNLPQGKCYSILVVGGQGMNNLDVTLSHEGHELASDASRNAFPDVRLCTEEGGRYDLEVRAGQGSGDYFYQVFERASQ